MIRECGNAGSLEALLAYIRISLDTKLVIKPIEMGKVTRRILDCTAVKVFRRNILEAAGDLELWAGQSVECDTAVRALKSIFSNDHSDVVLLLDTNNLFKRINQNVMLNNSRMICPIIGICVIFIQSRS